MYERYHHMDAVVCSGLSFFWSPRVSYVIGRGYSEPGMKTAFSNGRKMMMGE